MNDEVEIFTPNEQFLTQVIEIKGKDGENLEVANTNDEIFIKFSHAPKTYKYAIARTPSVLYINKKSKL